MKHRKLKVFLCLLGCVACLSSCGSSSDTTMNAGNSEQDSPKNNLISTGYLSYQYQYAGKNGIELCYNPKQSELADWITEQNIFQQSPVAVEKETGLFSSGKYKLTVSNGEYYYRGESEDNCPNGFGMLSKASNTFPDLGIRNYVRL